MHLGHFFNFLFRRNKPVNRNHFRFQNWSKFAYETLEKMYFNRQKYQSNLSIRIFLRIVDLKT